MLIEKEDFIYFNMNAYHAVYYDFIGIRKR